MRNFACDNYSVAYRRLCNGWITLSCINPFFYKWQTMCVIIILWLTEDCENGQWHVGHMLLMASCICSSSPHNMPCILVNLIKSYSTQYWHKKVPTTLSWLPLCTDALIVLKYTLVVILWVLWLPIAHFDCCWQYVRSHTWALIGASHKL